MIDLSFLLLFEADDYHSRIDERLFFEIYRHYDDDIEIEVRDEADDELVDELILIYADDAVRYDNETIDEMYLVMLVYEFVLYDEVDDELDEIDKTDVERNVAALEQDDEYELQQIFLEQWNASLDDDEELVIVVYEVDAIDDEIDAIMQQLVEVDEVENAVELDEL